MKPGKMRHSLTLQRVSLAPDQYGQEVATWSDLATVRAELVSEEALELASETAGTRGRRKVTFRTRAFGGLSVADRVLWKAVAFDLVQIGGGEFAEGRGLELVCEGAA